MKKTFQFSMEIEDDGRCRCPIFDDCYETCNINIKWCVADLRDRPDDCPLIEVENNEDI